MSIRRVLVPLLTLATAATALVAPSPAGAAYEQGEPAQAWAVHVDAGGDDQVNAVDSYAGRTYAVGQTDGVLGAASAGGTDAFVRVLDTRGAVVRTDQLGTASFDTAYAVDAGPWGVLVAGWTDGAFPDLTNTAETDAFVRLYGPDGAARWTAQVGDSSDPLYVSGITVSGSHVVVTGDVDTGESGSDANRDVFVLTLALVDGAFEENNTAGFTSLVESAGGVAAVPGGFVVAGTTSGDLDAPASTTGNPDNGWVERYRLTASGAPVRLWKAETTDTARDSIDAIDVSGDRVFYTGRREPVSGTDLGVVGSLRLSDGAAQWRRAIGSNDARGSALVTTAQGPVVAGYGTGAVASEPGTSSEQSAFVQGWTPAGRRLWTTRLLAAPSGNVYAFDLARASHGLVLGGWVQGALFGTASAGTDGFATLLQAQRPVVRPATKRVVARFGRTTTTRVRVVNNGDLADRLRLKGCAAPGTRLTVTQGRKDVTAAVRRGTYRTPSLAPGRATTLTLNIKPKRNKATTITCSQLARSTVQSQAAGAATFTIVVRKVRR